MSGRGRGTRGRGRGGRVGRGGRGRIGRGRGRFGRSQSGSRNDEANSSAKKEEVEMDVNTNVNAFFVGNASIAQHYNAQNTNKNRYAAGMAVLEQNRVEIVQNARIRALAAAWARNDFTFANALLQNRDSFGLVEVLKALQLLDSGRQVRVKEKQLKRLQLSKNKVLGKTLGKLKSDINNLKAVKSPYGSASGAVCKHIRRWVRAFTKENLEFYALHLPKEPWKKLADLCHFHPEKDFPNLTWFLPYCYGKDAPEETMVHRCGQITAENVNKLLEEFPIPYGHIKEYKDSLTQDSKLRIANYETKLDTLLWYYEELRDNQVDQVILNRIKGGETTALPIGKLMDRLLMMKMYKEGIPERAHYGGKAIPKEDPDKTPFISQLIDVADCRLKDISLPLEGPIVVSGDASGSMEIAIRTSSIIAGLLTAVCSAKLVFFDKKIRYQETMPSNMKEILQVAIDTKTGGSTSPAASLYPFYENKEVIKTFIMVTDEEENTKCEGYNFAELYQKYYHEVYPMRLVFVSFLRNQHLKGKMVSKLGRRGFKPLQFKFHRRKPDLTKLDKMFGVLSTESNVFEDELVNMEKKIKNNGLSQIFQTVEMEQM